MSNVFQPIENQLLREINNNIGLNVSKKQTSRSVSSDTEMENLTTLQSITNNLASRASPPLNEIKRIHRVVFTGGPCAGKTTSINRIKNFFENIGWKVYCVPETATTLLSAGIYFYDLSTECKINFQENLLKTLVQIEDSINDVAKHHFNDKNQSCMIIYDRGAMDPIAYLAAEEWEILKMRNPHWNEVDLRDNRYDQIIHLITAANGAEQFYTLDNNVTRTETIQVAREIDERCAKAWIGHPCMDVIDNEISFERKVSKSLQAVCERIGLKLKSFEDGNRKRKFLLKSLPDDSKLPMFQELNVVHNYLTSTFMPGQVRLRKSGQHGNWSYSYAVRTTEDGQMVETRTQLDRREYAILSKTIDANHWTIYQKRRCFIWHHRYYRMDIYEEPCNPSCRGLIILSTRTSEKDLLLPEFLEIEREITDDQSYSMFNLSMKENKETKA